MDDLKKTIKSKLKDEDFTVSNLNITPQADYYQLTFYCNPEKTNSLLKRVPNILFDLGYKEKYPHVKDSIQGNLLTFDFVKGGAKFERLKIISLIIILMLIFIIIQINKIFKIR